MYISIPNVLHVTFEKVVQLWKGKVFLKSILKAYIVILKTVNFISIHYVKYVSQFPQQILFLNILRLSLKFSNIDMIPFPWINLDHIWSAHEFFQPISLFLTQISVFSFFFFDKAILILYFLTREPIISIYLFGLFNKFSSAHLNYENEIV